MKRILIIQNEIPNYRLGLYHRLGKRVDLTVLHSGNEIKGDDLNFKQIVTKTVSVSKFIFQKKVYSSIRSGNYDVLIVMMDLAWIKNLLLAFTHGKKVLYWGHRYSESSIANSLRNFFMKRVKGNLLYSECDVSKMNESGLKSDSIFIAHNTMTVDNMEDCSNSEKNTFLFVGRAQKRKRVEELINAFNNIKSQLPDNTEINIIGEGAVNEELKALSKKLKIENKVKFLGKINDPEILKKHFSKAYAYVSPGPVGLGVLHSFSYGIPVVTFHEGKHGPEFSNILHNENGVIYKSTEELNQTLVKLANNHSFAKNLGESAFNHYSNKRSVDVMINGFITAINSVK